MATVVLEGNARITSLREGQPSGGGTLRLWTLVGRSCGARAISLRTMEFAPGRSPGYRNSASEEVLYLLEGRGTVFLDGWPFPVAPETGLYLPPGAAIAVDNSGPGPLVIVSSRCPEPDEEPELLRARTRPEAGAARPARAPLVRLSDRQAVPTGDRWYRVLVDEAVGSTQVTQFVGSIPPGRAPDHRHHYEEVLCVLSGRGVMWAGRSSAPIGPGSCIYLPPRQIHCVENTGDRELRLLGIFHPAGSPAARYGPEG